MVVTIELFGVHRVHAKTESIMMPITEHTLVAMLLNMSGTCILITSGRASGCHYGEREVVSLDRQLKARDVIRLLPHIGGG